MASHVVRFISESSATKMPAGTVLFSSGAPIGLILPQLKMRSRLTRDLKSVIPHEAIGTTCVCLVLQKLLPSYCYRNGCSAQHSTRQISGAGMKSVATVLPESADSSRFYRCYQILCCQPMLHHDQEILEAENRRLSALKGDIYYCLS